MRRRLILVAAVITCAALAACSPADKEGTGNRKSKAKVTTTEPTNQAGTTTTTVPKPKDRIEAALSNSVTESGHVEVDFSVERSEGDDISILSCNGGIAAPAKPGDTGDSSLTCNFKGTELAKLDPTAGGDLTDFGDVSFDMLVVNHVIYLKLPPFPGIGSLGPEGRPWLKLDLASLGETVGNTGGLEGLRADKLLTTIAENGGSIEEVGEEKVRDAPTTHFKMQIDAGALIAALNLDSSVSEVVDDSIKEMAPLSVDLWLDDNNLVHRGRISLPMETMAGSDDLVPDSYKGALLVITTDVFDIGAQVTVAAPTPEETFDLADMIASFVGGLPGIDDAANLCNELVPDDIPLPCPTTSAG